MIENAKDDMYADDTPDELVMVPTFRGGFLKFQESTILRMLGNLLAKQNKHRAYYVGGTLCVDYRNPKEKTSTQPLATLFCLVFNVRDDSMGFAIQEMVAQLYARYKTPKHSHWKAAQEIIDRGNEITEV